MNRTPSAISISFATCCAGMMALAIGINLLPVFFTTLQRTMGSEGGGLTNEQLGRIVSVGFAGLVGAVFITGPLADRLGTRIFALVGNGLLIAGLALLAAAGGYDAVLLASFILGLGAGMLDMVLSPIVGALKPENRSSAMNYLHSFYCTGSMLCVMIAAGAIRLGISWRTAAMVLCILPLLVLVAFCVIYIPPMGHEEHPEGRQRLRDMLKHRTFFLALLAIAFGGATEMGMASWLPAYAESTLGFSRFEAALAFTGFLAAMSIGRIAVGMIGKPANVVRVMIGCCLGSIVLFLAASFAGAGIALISCICAGFAGSALWPSMLAVTADRYPRGGASMFGALAAAGNVGAVLMPWLVGVTADHFSMRLGLSTGAVPPLLMALTLLLMLRQRGA